MHSAVYYADPRFVDVVIDDEQEVIDAAHNYYKYLFIDLGESWWSEVGEDIWTDFRNKMGVFANVTYPGKSASAFESHRWYCKLAARYRKVAPYARKMAKLIKCCGTNAGMERTFNFVRRIHTPQRGALGPKTVDKLVYVACNTVFLKKQILELIGITDCSTDDLKLDTHCMDDLYSSYAIYDCLENLELDCLDNI
eukprot:935152_1